jgi:glycosyltransferase involved in cell wall biosynthesis
MKILFVHCRYLQNAGGEDSAVAAETSLLTSHGHTVNTLFFSNEESGNGIITKIKTGIRAVYNSGSAKKLKEAISVFRPDVIHIHNFFYDASPAVILQAYKEKIPVVVTIHNYRLICASAILLRDNKICELCVHNIFPWHGVIHKCYHHSAVQSAVVGSISGFHKLTGTWRKKVNKYITPSAFIRSKLLHSSLKVSADKILVKRNFIEDPGVSAMENRNNYFLFVGRLTHEKGIDVLLRCFKDLPGIELIIAGGGPEKDALVQQYGHLENVQFRGLLAKPDIIALMKNCKALIFPSVWYEGLPVTIVEAFATGTPVIASRLGAMEEMIQHKINGLLFEAGEPEKLKAAVQAFNEYTGKERFSLYEEARQSYLNYFHPSKCYEAVMDIYNAAIEKSTSKPAHE